MFCVGATRNGNGRAALGAGYRGTRSVVPEGQANTAARAVGNDGHSRSKEGAVADKTQRWSTGSNLADRFHSMSRMAFVAIARKESREDSFNFFRRGSAGLESARYF